MKISMIGFLLIFLAASPLLPARRFSIYDIANADKEQENALYLLQNLDDLWRNKQDKNPAFSLGAPRFIVAKLSDKILGVQNAYAIMENIDDLWRNKVDISTPSFGRRFILDDLSDPDKSEENSFKLNAMFDDLWQEKADR